MTADEFIAKNAPTLKPCPFCGAPGRLKKMLSDYVRIGCSGGFTTCPAYEGVSFWFGSPLCQDAVYNWNTRRVDEHDAVPVCVPVSEDRRFLTAKDAMQGLLASRGGFIADAVVVEKSVKIADALLDALQSKPRPAQS